MKHARDGRSRIIDTLAQFKRNYITDYAVKSYSQEGEDIILRRLFEGVAKGFYVDVGAHHPKRFSNSYYFYKIGWSGINIDAMPGSMRAFNEFRPRDINLEAAVSGSEKEMIYHVFNDPALNTFDPDLAASYLSDRYFIVEKIALKTRSLAAILADKLPPRTKINFMSIDVEGLDLEVVMSNDWEKYRPDILLVEFTSRKVSEVVNSELYKFLSEKNYDLIAKTHFTAIFESQSG